MYDTNSRFIHYKMKYKGKRSLAVVLCHIVVTWGVFTPENLGKVDVARVPESPSRCTFPCRRSGFFQAYNRLERAGYWKRDLGGVNEFSIWLTHPSCPCSKRLTDARILQTHLKGRHTEHSRWRLNWEGRCEIWCLYSPPCFTLITRIFLHTSLTDETWFIEDSFSPTEATGEEPGWSKQLLSRRKINEEGWLGTESLKILFSLLNLRPCLKCLDRLGAP